MNGDNRYATRVTLIAAFGGFLMGFDASVISGVVGSIELRFGLSSLQLGWAVASLTLTASLGMMLAGPLSDRIGRRPVLALAAVIFLCSALASALSQSFATLVAARMFGGLGVGAVLIVAPMYIAELAPAAARGRMVSFNQLNIVIGISAAFFSNYLILQASQSDLGLAHALRLQDWGWRWMLGIEALPALLYLFALRFVPESPRWQAMHGQFAAARSTLKRVSGRAAAEAALADVLASLHADASRHTARLRELLRPSMRLVMTVGITVAVLQQITGINAVFFYAPVIFEQSGIGTNAAFMQAVLVGLVNLVFTVIAMFLIDRLGRRPLLGFGLVGIAACMFLLAWAFGTASYTLTADAAATLSAPLQSADLQLLLGQTYYSDVSFRSALTEALGPELAASHGGELLRAAISMNAALILFAILGFVASFALSLGPVMWVLFSELFPNRLRGLAVSFVGLINSTVSFTVQLAFPWELEHLGNATTFCIYGVFGLVGLLIVMRVLPETRGRSLEQLEQELVRGNPG